MNSMPASICSTTRVAVVPRAFSSLWMRARLAALCGVLALMTGGAWTCGQAQTAHFVGTQYVVANAATNVLSYPNGVATDANGNVYIADTDNSRVLKETLSAGSYIQSVVADAAINGLAYPKGVAVDANGNVYIADTDNSRVLKETLSAGSYTQSVVANAAINGLAVPRGVAVDKYGDVYIADYLNNRVLELAASGSVYAQFVVADKANNGLSSPDGVAVDGGLNVYIADYGNSRVLKETQSFGTYTQSVIANATTNGVSNPTGVAVDGSGNIFIDDYGNNRVLEETLSAGSYTQSVVATAGLNLPDGVAVDANGNVYVADTENSRVLEETFSGGNFGRVNVGSTSQTPISMIFAFDTAGTLGSTAVLTMGATGLDFTDAGTGSCKAGTAYTAGAACTVDVSFTPKFTGARYGAAELLDGSGNVIATGSVQGTGVGPQVTFLPGTQSVIANIANNGLNNPEGIAVDGSGNLYIADTQNQRVLKETLAAGSYTQSVVADDNPPYLLVYPEGVAVDGSGNVYIADSNRYLVTKETPSGGSYTQSVVADFIYDSSVDPGAVAVDSSGNVYITDLGFGQVVKETPTASGYVESVVANAATNSLSYPKGVAVDANGNVYIADTDNSRVLKETLSAGGYTQSVVASQVTNGLNQPEGVAVDGSGNVYISDTNNGRELKEDLADPPSLSFAKTAVGKTSTDSPKTITLLNNGNAVLTFLIPGTGDNPSISADFTLNGSGASVCPLVASGSSMAGTLPAGASCLLRISFTPAAIGALSGSLVLTDNNLNVTNATQTIALSGTGTAPSPPFIAAQPTSQTVPVGSPATFSVTAIGVPTLTYQWKYLSGTTWKPFGAGTGYNTATLTTFATSAAYNGLQLKVVVTDGNSKTVTSNIVTLTVDPAITTQPTSQTVTDGSTASFSVVAAGVPTLTYQWQYLSGSTWKPFGAGTGYNTATLTTFVTTAAYNGLQLRAVVTDGNSNTVTSNIVALTVGPAITTQPFSQTVTNGSTASFSVVAAGVPTLTYQWQYLSGSTWKPFGAGTGYNTATLTTFVTTAAYNGLQLRAVVTDGNSNTVTSNIVTLTVGPAITTQPFSQTVTNGSTASFSVVAAGVPTLTYQWQYLSGSTWKPFGAGTGYNTASLTTFATTAAYNGLQLRAVVTDGDGLTATSNTITLTVQ